MTELDWLKVATDLGSLGIVAWLVQHTFARTLPDLHRQFGEELQKERDVTASSLRQVYRAIDRLSIVLIYHDASTRGINPEAVGSTEELLRLLRHPNGGDPQ